MHGVAVVDMIRRHAVQIELESAAQRLLEAIDPHVSIVLIGEATHGTLEFYRIRADLTRTLIRQRGFNLVAVEADWPDAYRANQWVRLLGTDSTAEEALADFTRFPRWMWTNREVVRFLRWLRSEAMAAMAAFFFVLSGAGGETLAADSPAYRQATTACLTAIIAVILLIDYTPIGHTLFGTAPIGLTAWLIVLPFAMAMLVLEEGRKAFVRSGRGHRQRVRLAPGRT